VNRARPSDVFLILGFLAVIFGVPAAQIALELRRGQRVQFTDLFRQVPTPVNLRRYENALETQSWVRQEVRPAMQRVLFQCLRDTGAKALLGAHGWVFYRPGVRYLVEGDRPGTAAAGSLWVEPADHGGRRRAAVRAIIEYRDRLQERGIELLVVPVPEKSSVYPDLLTRRANPQTFRSPTEEFLEKLRQAGVEVVDLFALFRQARSSADRPTTEGAYYLTCDTHWTPDGARLAAGAVADRIRQRGWLPKFPRKYQVNRVGVRRRGDVVEMMQVPGLQTYFPAQAVVCSQLVDKIPGLLVPKAGDPEGTFANSHLKDTPLEPTLLLLGDSFSRIYQLPEPQSLGEMSSPAAANSRASGRGAMSTKRLLPGSAGFPSLLAEILQSPVDYIVSDGGAATEVRQRLSTNGEILENKRVVVWEFTERDVGAGREGWQSVPLPPKQ
jgi:hypothetical protein